MADKKQNNKKKIISKKETKKDDLTEAAESLEKELNLPENFLQNLLEEDDWSFIIKLHALMEASVSYLLVHHFGDSRLSKIFEHLELSDAKKGKIAFVSELELLPSENRRFLRRLSELRNILVHNVINVKFNLENYVNGLNKDQFSNFLKAVEVIDLSRIDFGKNNENLQSWIAYSAKQLIYRYGIVTMGFIYWKRETAEFKRKIEEINKSIGEKFMKVNK